MITPFTVDLAERKINELADLLIDAVDSGASVGFMPPDARKPWRIGAR